MQLTNTAIRVHCTNQFSLLLQNQSKSKSLGRAATPVDNERQVNYGLVIFYNMHVPPAGSRITFYFA